MFLTDGLLSQRGNLRGKRVCDSEETMEGLSMAPPCDDFLTLGELARKIVFKIMRTNEGFELAFLGHLWESCFRAHVVTHNNHPSVQEAEAGGS